LAAGPPLLRVGGRLSKVEVLDQISGATEAPALQPDQIKGQELTDLVEFVRGLK
jgi:hypothetical protein